MSENAGDRRKPVDFDELFPGRFLKGGEVPRPVTLQITDVYTEVLPSEKGDKRRGILSFARTDKEMVLNKTNAEAIKAMFGRAPQEWIGKRITMANDPDVMLGRERVGGVRVVGSPELTRAITFELKLPRRRPRNVTLRPTGRTSQPGGSNPGPASEPGPDSEPYSGPISEPMREPGED